MEKKELRKKIEELDIKRKVSEMKGDVVNYDTDNQYHYISEEDILELLDKAREEVERKFVEKYHKRGKEMNVPYSEEDGKEFWQGYQEGYNQGLRDMIVDTYYLDKEFELKLKQ